MSVFEESKSYRPFTYPWAVEAEKAQVIETYWHEDQIDLQDDLRQYHSIDGLRTQNRSHGQNKKVLDTLLLFFTQLDMSVASGYVDLLPHTKNNEIKSLLIQEAAKEVRHQRAYALAGETFGFSDADWSAFQKYKEMVDKVDAIVSSKFDPSTSLGYALKLTQVICGEGIGLFAAFAGLLNFKRHGLLIGFNDINSWSLLDEYNHVENNIKVVQEIICELNDEERRQLISKTKKLVAKFVEIEHKTIDLITEDGELEDISNGDFKNYITYLGNSLLFRFGYIGSLEVGTNPLKWMESMLSSERHGAFFEKKITDYTHRKLSGEVDYAKYLPLLEAKL